MAQLRNYFDTKVAEIIKNITGIANFKKTNLGTKRYAVVKNLLIKYELKTVIGYEYTCKLEIIFPSIYVLL